MFYERMGDFVLARQENRLQVRDRLEPCAVDQLSGSVDRLSLIRVTPAADRVERQGADGSSRTQMFRKLIGGLGSPWACSLIGADV